MSAQVFPDRLEMKCSLIQNEDMGLSTSEEIQTAN
jgi:hypothetical protein